MSKSVVLNLGKGSLQEGFADAIAQIYECEAEVHLFSVQFTGSLPAAPQLIQLYRRWQILYNLLYDSLIPDLTWRQKFDSDAEIEIESEDVTNISSVEFSNLCDDLKNQINAWLNNPTFVDLEQKLRTKLNSNEEIQVIIQTHLDEVRRLPWNLWDFFDDYPNAVLCLSKPDFEKLDSIRKPNRDKIRILAILGSSENIDTQEDKIILENLPGAETVFLIEAQRQEIDLMLWDKTGWDILFFAGHSSTQENGETGKIYLNSRESLTIEQLKKSLRAAISRGLHLAIFNSCDGLGLATQLASLQIPQMIVMREPVADLVAQRFLKFFLSSFSEFKSFNLAVREAGDKLQGLEAEFPCASWLPVICQNPTEAPLVWSNSTQNSHKLKTSSPLNYRKIIPAIFAVSLAIATAIVGVRSLGLLEAGELTAFDRMMRSRPYEGKDNRILIVEITEADVQAQNPEERGAASISDAALAELINKLEKYNPRIIGLNIYRDSPIKSQYENLSRWMQTTSKFIGVCQGSEGEENPGVPPPPELSSESLGFTDIVEDSDAILRRHLLAMAPAQPCNTDKSFSFQLAAAYLAQENIHLELNPEAAQSKNKLNNQLILPYLESNSGSYSNIDSLGYQVMLNWRSTPEIAQRITLQDVLADKLTPDLVKDKIVIIGTTAESFNNYWSTPYSLKSPQHQTPGVVIHAHMVSQIISAALDNRPLLWVWSKWTEAFWIYCWAIVGGILAWRCKSSLQLALTLGLSQAVLYFLCYSILIQGGWIPFIPSVFALIAGSGSVATYKLRKQK
ncbi:putative transmembrane sensor domain protein [Rivularia sp. PCC 7116]|uniref:CHASE2 domain-containing protein n=1 Tax=Rivularia sp. PCC 7116 TaxID=373994 RepID=UPI00029F38E7|nr:CHASE2 domain-containing protein [Rivularia sp. PCC 7116]AFY58584.1 putative transmembrane sensor domain protein [Rivularia sp. PCC 7116]